MPKLVNPKPQKECVGTIHPTEKDHGMFIDHVNNNINKYFLKQQQSSS